MDCNSGYFDKLFFRLNKQDLMDCPYHMVIEAYLYRNLGKKINRHDSFWNSQFIFKIPTSLFRTDEFTIALSRYFAQKVTSNYKFITKVLSEDPEVIITSIRRSEIVLDKSHCKWNEIRELSVQYPNILDELIATCEAFQSAHQERLDLVQQSCKPIEHLTLFEFLSYSAAYSFSHLVEPALSYDGKVIGADSQVRALSSLVQWKLRHSTERDFVLNDNIIAQSLKKYHLPLFLPFYESSASAKALLMLFEQLIQAQVELHEFISQSVHPFCFDDSLHFSVKNGMLQLIRKNNDSSDNWERNGNRQQMIRGYWFNMAMDEFVLSGLAEKQMGSAENNEQNQVAYVKAIASRLELENIYGFSKFVTVNNGFKVDLFQALLSQELMMAYYLKEFIQFFYSEYTEVQDWRKALGILVIKGLERGENRFPITWSLWREKIKKIVGWTVSSELPNGNIKSAEAILAFWELNMKRFSKSLKNGIPITNEQLTEHPIFKIGNYSVQLPWLMSGQISSLNTVNNLRRFANQRNTLKDETTRIENRLGDKFESKGFVVFRNFTIETSKGIEAGEIDLICALDNIVIVLEIKSTYYRTTKKEVFHHRDNTLRKAGIQVRKKVAALKAELESNSDLKQKLQFTVNSPKVVGWIADTSTEFDHDLFNGFMKVSVAELYIALSDNAYFLRNIEQTASSSMSSQEEMTFSSEPYSLYKNEFSAQEFISVIEQSKVWNYENFNTSRL